MEKHVTLVGALHMGYGAFHVLCALVAFLFTVGGGLLGGLIAEEEFVIGITFFIATTIALWVILISVPSIIGGVWLLRHKPWARYMVLVLSVLASAQRPPRDRHRRLFHLGPGAGRDGKALRLWAQPVDCPAPCPATHRPAPLGGGCTHRTQLRGSYRVLVRVR